MGIDHINPYFIHSTTLLHMTVIPYPAVYLMACAQQKEMGLTIFAY